MHTMTREERGGISPWETRGCTRSDVWKGGSKQKLGRTIGELAGIYQEGPPSRIASLPRAEQSQRFASDILKYCRSVKYTA